MRHINFVAPVHRMHENSRKRIWLGFTSAVAVIVLFTAWILSPSQVMQPVAYPGSQLATTSGEQPPDSAGNSEFKPMHATKISQSLQRVHTAMAAVTPDLLELITVNQSGGKTRLIFKAITKGDHHKFNQIAPDNHSSAHFQQLEQILVALNTQHGNDREAWIENDSKGSPQIHFKML